MREHKIVTPKRAREEVGEESLNGRVKGARHGCPRRNRVTSMFAEGKRALLFVLKHWRLLAVLTRVMSKILLLIL